MEENIQARIECVKHHGYSCCICGFNYEEFYGKIAKYAIDVHNINSPMEAVNPVRDLRPICLTCKKVIHSKEPCYTIEEVKEMIERINSERKSI